MRIYDPRIGRFLSVDPLTNKYPELTPYQFASNMPIIAVDLDGLEAKIVTIYHSGRNGKEFYRTVQNKQTINTFLGIVKSEVITIHKFPSVSANGKTTWNTVTGIFAADDPVNFQTGRIDLSTQSNFYLYQDRIFNHEGGYSDDPADPGGATNKGITIGTFKLYAEKDLGIDPTLDNLKNLTNDQAAIIYKNNYWDKVKGDDINNASLAYAIYDFNVNAGSNSVKVLQEAPNSIGFELKVNGSLDDATLNAVNSANSKRLFEKYQEGRKEYYQQIIQNSVDTYLKKHPDATEKELRKKTLKRFEKGWNNRVNKIKYKD